MLGGIDLQSYPFIFVLCALVQESSSSRNSSWRRRTPYPSVIVALRLKEANFASKKGD